MIVLSPADLRQIVNEAEQAYPRECCGLLVGHSDAEVHQVTEVHVSANLAESDHDRFEVDPALRLALQKRLRGGPDRVIGVYHSHPDHPAQPSETDLQMAWEPELIWLITSVANGQAIHTTAHFLADGGTRFAELPLHTTDWGPYPTRTPITWEGLT